MSKPATAMFVLAALVASCSSSTQPADLGPVPDGAFTTDATGYVAYSIPESPFRYRFRVVSRFENRGAPTLYLGRCYPSSPQPLFTVESATNAESGYAVSWACVGHNQQFAIRSGEMRIDTLVIEGPNAFQGGTNIPLGVVEGDFRLYYDVRLGAGDDAPPAPDSLHYSNAFRVRTSETFPP